MLVYNTVLYLVLKYIIYFVTRTVTYVQWEYICLVPANNNVFFWLGGLARLKLNICTTFTYSQRLRLQTTTNIKR